MPKKILIVDDDVETLRLVGLMLEREGYDVITAENGEHALNKIKNDPPDLVLLDVMMPEMSGYDVARHLRSHQETKLIPIIMFTAKTQIDDKVKGLEAGADAYLTKPTWPRELFAQVKVLLSRTKTSAAPTTVTGSESPSSRGFMIGVISAKGGVGVSSLSTNLGIALHKSTKKSVLVTDFRPGSSDIGLDLGYSNPDNLIALLDKPSDKINPAAIKNEMISHHSGIQLLLSPRRAKDAVYINAIESFTTIAQHLPFSSDYIVLDLGPALPPLTQAVIEYCDEVIIVIEPTQTGIEQTIILLEDLFELGIGEGRLRPVVINRNRTGMQVNWHEVQEKINLKIETVFTPAPDLAFISNAQSKPMILQQPKSITAEQFRKLASEIAN